MSDYLTGLTMRVIGAAPVKPIFRPMFGTRVYDRGDHHQLASDFPIEPLEIDATQIGDNGTHGPSADASLSPTEPVPPTPVRSVADDGTIASIPSFQQTTQFSPHRISENVAPSHNRSTFRSDEQSMHADSVTESNSADPFPSQRDPQERSRNRTSDKVVVQERVEETARRQSDDSVRSDGQPTPSTPSTHRPSPVAIDTNVPQPMLESIPAQINITRYPPIERSQQTRNALASGSQRDPHVPGVREVSTIVPLSATRPMPSIDKRMPPAAAPLVASQPETVVHVSIGRVEVRASLNSPSTKKAVRESSSQRGSQSLEAYLRGTGGGDRS